MGRISTAFRHWRRRMQVRSASPERRRMKPLLALGALAIAAMLAFTWFQRRLAPVVEQLAASRVAYLAGEVINDAINEQIALGGAAYDDLILLEKDSSGKVTALKTNMAAINKLKTDVTALVLERISSMDSSELAIPLGNIVDGELFSGRGPEIPIIVVPVGKAEADFSTALVTAGINQTRHQILVTVSADISVLLPGYETSTVVSSQVVVAETVIVGDVPQAYTYLEDTGTSPTELYDLVAEVPE